MRPEGPKIEAEGRERGWCSWGGDSKTPHQLVDLGSTASSPSRVIVLLVMLYDVFFFRYETNFSQKVESDSLHCMEDERSLGRGIDTLGGFLPRDD